MNATDELAEVIYKARWVDGIKDVTVAADAGIANAILAAGYSKPRTITTAAELDALAEGVILRAEQGGVWTRAVDGIGAVWRCAGYSHHYRADEIELPATVLFEREAA